MERYAIRELDRETWKGTILPFAYTSSFCYDISVTRTEDGYDIPIRKRKLEEPFVRRPEDGDFPDRLFADWWEDARAFGIAEDGQLLAVIEVCPETWSNRLMVTELFVCEELRGRGYGKELIGIAKDLTVSGGYRALILETQSSNVSAVDFYLHEGFGLIGFDSCCYSNRDVERREVRFDMGWFPKGRSGAPKEREG